MATHELRLIRVQERRLDSILHRFLEADDELLSDRDLVLRVLARWKKHQDAPILDVGDGVDLKELFK